MISGVMKMGLRDFLGLGSDDEEEISLEDVEIQEDEEPTIEEDDIFEEEEEDEEIVWESGWEYAWMWLEDEGFTTKEELVSKAMMRRINQSPRFRDRISMGRQTASMIREVGETIEGTGGDDGSTDWNQIGEQIEGANKAIDGIDKLSGEEEQMAWEIINLGYDALGAVADKTVESQGTGVSSSVDVVEE